MSRSRVRARRVDRIKVSTSVLGRARCRWWRLASKFDERSFGVVRHLAWVLVIT